MTGKFIIVNYFDDYVDVNINNIECSKNCLQDFHDPAFHIW